MLLLLLLPTGVIEVVAVTTLADEELESSGKPAVSVEVPDAPTGLMTTAVVVDAVIVGVLLPETISAVAKDVGELLTILEIEYDSSATALVEIP
jgi:hypothetical protein